MNPETAKIGRIHRANAGASRGELEIFGPRASGTGPAPDSSLAGASGAGGRARRIASTTVRSMAAARAAVFHKPSAGIARKPATATPATAPVVFKA